MKQTHALALLLASATAHKLSKFQPRDALFEYSYGDDMVGQEYLQDSPKGYNDLVQLGESRRHRRARTHRTRDWDEDGQEAMNEGDYKGDAPPGYDADLQHRHRRAHRNRDWDLEGEAAMNPTEYNKDSPVGYQKQPSRRGLREQVLRRRPAHHAQGRHMMTADDFEEKAPKQAAPAEAGNVQLAKWGVPEYEDTVDHLKDIIMDHSDEKEYLEDGPGRAYQAVPYDVVTAQLGKAKWGEVAEEDTPEHFKGFIAANSNPGAYQADEPKGYKAIAPPEEAAVQVGKWGEVSEEDSVDTFKEMLSENSNENEYLEDGPGRAYIAAPYDITTALLKVSEGKWGEVAEEDTPEALKGTMASHSNQFDYSHDEPRGYKAIAPPEEAAVQIQKWGVPEYEDTFDWVKDQIMDHSNENDYVSDAPKGLVAFDPVNLQTKHEGPKHK